MLVADSVSSQCSGEAFRPHFLRREGGDFLDCSVGGLCVGSTADGLRCRGAGVPALPDQLCSDGFCCDSATAATLGTGKTDDKSITRHKDMGFSVWLNKANLSLLNKNEQW